MKKSRRQQGRFQSMVSVHRYAYLDCFHSRITFSCWPRRNGCCHPGRPVDWSCEPGSCTQRKPFRHFTRRDLWDDEEVRAASNSKVLPSVHRESRGFSVHSGSRAVLGFLTQLSPPCLGGVFLQLFLFFPLGIICHPCSAFRKSCIFA